MSRRLVILGGGGHARVLAQSLRQQGEPPSGYCAPTDQGELLPGIPWLGDDDWLQRQSPERQVLVNGLGSTGDTRQRRQLFERFQAAGFRFATVRDPSALLAHMLQLGEGCQFLPGTIVNTGCHIGDNVIVNSGVVVEHDCELGGHVHLASGAVVCGGCRIGAGVHVGAGAVLIQGIRIGHGALIAAGAVVTHNVEPLTLAAGVPASARRRLTEDR